LLKHIQNFSELTKTTSWTYKLTIGADSVSFIIRSDELEESKSLPILDNVINDGLWHHVVVSWRNTQGFLAVFVDGQFNNQVKFAMGQQLPTS